MLWLYSTTTFSFDLLAVRRKSYDLSGVDRGEHVDGPLVHPLKGEHSWKSMLSCPLGCRHLLSVCLPPPSCSWEALWKVVV